jgi:ankyrin repeat domain-containing protein 54
MGERLTSPTPPTALFARHRHVACTRDDHEVLKLLIKHKADLEARDCIGNTPLHLAACTNHTAVITELLQAGCDSGAKDTNGRTPFDFAHGHLKIMQRSRSDDFTHRKKLGEITEMLQTFMRMSGHARVDEMDALADRLSRTSTRAEVDQVAILLEGFAEMGMAQRTSGGGSAV